MSDSAVRIAAIMAELATLGVPAELLIELRDAIDDAVNEAVGDGMGY